MVKFYDSNNFSKKKLVNKFSIVIFLPDPLHKASKSLTTLSPKFRSWATIDFPAKSCPVREYKFSASHIHYTLIWIRWFFWNILGKSRSASIWKELLIDFHVRRRWPVIFCQISIQHRPDISYWNGFILFYAQVTQPYFAHRPHWEYVFFQSFPS